MNLLKRIQSLKYPISDYDFEAIRKEIAVNSNTKLMTALFDLQFHINTGTSLYDSGSIYGRKYNSDSRKHSYRPCVYYDNSDFVVDTSVYLANILDIDRDCLELQRRLDVFDRLYAPENFAKLFENFCQALEKKDLIYDWSVENTYNHTTNLDNVLRYCTICFKDNDHPFYSSIGDSEFVLLQTHNGCDVRSGYTWPYVYRCKSIFCTCPEIVGSVHAEIYEPLFGTKYCIAKFWTSIEDLRTDPNILIFEEVPEDHVLYGTIRYYPSGIPRPCSKYIDRLGEVTPKAYLDDVYLEQLLNTGYEIALDIK